MKIKTLSMALLLLAAAVGCKENDIALYGESPRLEFVKTASCAFDDKDYFNAYISDTPKREKECEVTAQLIGRLLPEPRTFCMKAQPVSTSAFEVLVSFADTYTFPAAAATATAKVPVTCPKKEGVSTRTKTKEGVVHVVYDTENAGHQFGAGRIENMKCRMEVTLQIYPSSWDSKFWGSYSTAKYFFMMETFKATYDKIEKKQENRVKVRAAYNKYKEEHGPLYGDDDESETEITFPLS